MASLLVSGCSAGADASPAAVDACRKLGVATQQSDPNEMLFKLAEAQRTADANGEDSLAEELDALARALVSGDAYAMGTAAIDVNETCKSAGVDIDTEFG